LKEKQRPVIGGYVNTPAERSFKEKNRSSRVVKVQPDLRGGEYHWTTARKKDRRRCKSVRSRWQKESYNRNDLSFRNNNRKKGKEGGGRRKGKREALGKKKRQPKKG